jgi:hypothetical protein
MDLKPSKGGEVVRKERQTSRGKVLLGHKDKRMYTGASNEQMKLCNRVQARKQWNEVRVQKQR